MFRRKVFFIWRYQPSESSLFYGGFCLKTVQKQIQYFNKIRNCTRKSSHCLFVNKIYLLSKMKYDYQQHFSKCFDFTVLLLVPLKSSGISICLDFGKPLCTQTCYQSTEFYYVTFKNRNSNWFSLNNLVRGRLCRLR